MRQYSTVNTIWKGGQTRKGSTAGMTSGLKVRHHFSSRSKNISLTTSLFVTQLWRLKSVRVGTPWPSGPLTRWVAFHWVLWTLQLDKHSMVHSACLAAVWSARPRQDPWLQSICCPIATSAALPLLCRKIKKSLAWKHDLWFVCTLSGWI